MARVDDLAKLKAIHRVVNVEFESKSAQLGQVREWISSIEGSISGVETELASLASNHAAPTEPIGLVAMDQVVQLRTRKLQSSKRKLLEDLARAKAEEQKVLIAVSQAFKRATALDMTVSKLEQQRKTELAKRAARL